MSRLPRATRRDTLRLFVALAASGAFGPAWASVAPRIVAVRAWPGKDSTRVTIESDGELQFSLSTLSNPERAYVDLQQIQVDATLQQLVANIRNDLGVIARARLGQFQPDVARLVLDLKESADTAVFTLRPIGQYKHRLVIDLTPNNSDPIGEFLAKLTAREAALEYDATKPPTPERPPLPVDNYNPPPPAPPAPAPAPAPGASRPPRAPSPNKTPVGPRRPAPSYKPFVVVLDPGHGGEDPGAIGPMGTYEKTVVLAIAQKTRALLEQDRRIVVFMTRDEDVFIPLAERVRKARAVNADVFVSIHADAFTRPEARGSSVYTLSERGATSTAARWLANKENQSDLIGGVRLTGRDPMLARMLLEIHQSVTQADSLKLGRGMVNELAAMTTMHKRNVEQAAFAVLRAPDVPSVLIETAFISNPIEEQRLRNPAHQDRLARAIRNGIRAFLATRQTVVAST